VKTAGIL